MISEILVTAEDPINLFPSDSMAKESGLNGPDATSQVVAKSNDFKV